MPKKIIAGVERNILAQPLDLIFDGANSGASALCAQFKYAHDPVTSNRYLINDTTEGLDIPGLDVGAKFQAEVSTAHYVARIVQIYPAQP